MTATPAGDANTVRPTLLGTLEQLLAIQATDVKPALDAASTLIATAMGADKVDTFLYDPVTHTLVAAGTSLTPMGRQQHALGLNRLPLVNGGRTVETFQSGQVYHHGQVDTDQKELRGIREGLHIRSAIAVPLAIGSERRGVLQIDSAQREAFSLDDVHFLQAVAHWVGLIIQRTELVEQLTCAAREEAQRVTAEDLITILAHDLRNHLTPILARSSLLKRHAERDGRTMEVKQLATLETQTERLVRLVTDLLDVGRLQQGLFRLRIQPVNLAALACETAVLLQQAAAPIQVDAPDEALAEADPERLRQALENLLTNAQRYTPANVPVSLHVRVEQRANGAWVVFEVYNAGPEIPPERLAHIFQRFGRGPESEGLGLGLYLARGIATAHEGTLTVDSQSNRGTTFTLAVPAAGPSMTSLRLHT